MAQGYCINCKNTYHELSKIVQGVLASRKELARYDQKKAELGSVFSPSEPSTPAVLSTPTHSLDEVSFSCHLISLLDSVYCSSICLAQFIGFLPPLITQSYSPTSHLPPQPPSFPSAASQIHKSQCFGCCSAATEHCVTLLKSFALQPQTRRQLVLRKLIQELVDFNLRNGNPQMQRDIRDLLCIVTRDDEVATAELNKYVSDRVLEHISPNRTTPTLVS